MTLLRPTFRSLTTGAMLLAKLLGPAVKLREAECVCKKTLSLIFLCFSFTASAAQTSNTFQTMQALRSKGQLEEATQVGQAYLKKHPEDVDVQLLLGLIAYQKHDYKTAKTNLNQVLTRVPTYLDAKITLLRIAIAQKDTLEIERLLQEIVQQSPEDPRVITLQKGVSRLSAIPALPRKNPVLPNPIRTMQVLRSKNKLDAAIKLGQNYLSYYPKDADVLLIMGSIALQKKEYALAESYLLRAQRISPRYLDIQFTLIKLYLAKKEVSKAKKIYNTVRAHSPNHPETKKLALAFSQIAYQDQLMSIHTAMQNKNWTQALRCAQKLLKKQPDDIPLHLLLANIYRSLNQPVAAIKQYQWILKKEPNNKQVLIAWANTELAQSHDLRAMTITEYALRRYPEDPDFLTLKGRIFENRKMYPYAAQIYKSVLKAHPEAKPARNQLDVIKSINPYLTNGPNELGVNGEIDYISDLKQNWQYYNAFYNKDTALGLLSLNLNNAYRFYTDANQLQVNLFPSINHALFFRTTFAYANEPVLFPTYWAGGEVFLIDNVLSFSAGWDYNFIIRRIQYERYTFSVSKEIGDYFFSFRPYFFVPLYGKKSTLFTGAIYRYLGAKDTYLKIYFGSGTSPDLANLTTIDFITINNNFITGTIQIPLFNDRLLLGLGADYQHWVFQNNGRIRNITGGIFSLNYRFEDFKYG